MIKAVIWNIRGVGDRDKLKYLKDLIRNHHINLLVLLETKAHSTAMPRFSFQLGHVNKNIWIFWNSEFSISSAMVHEQFIQVTVAIPGITNSFAAYFVYASCKMQSRQSLWSGIFSNLDNNEAALIEGDFNVVAEEDEKNGKKGY